MLDRGLEAGGRYAALRAIVRRDVPHSAARPAGGALQHGAFDLDEAKALADGLDDSSLFVQGPPGSGKTYTGAHLICHLLSRGARVGVASSSHAAIHNLLSEVERFAGEDPGWRGVKKHSGTPESRFRSAREEPLIDNSDDIGEFAGGRLPLGRRHGMAVRSPRRRGTERAGRGPPTGRGRGAGGGALALARPTARRPGL